jgi:hypothetical protein
MLSFKQPITMKIPAPAGVKSLTFNFPSDDDLDRRQKARSFSVKGSVETTNECPNIDIEIINSARLEGDDLEISECSWLMNRLMGVAVTDGGRCENGFFVHLEQFGHTFRHELKIPSADQLQKFRKESLKSVPTRYGTTFTTHMRPGRALFDVLRVKSEGYPEDYVPITHKNTAISELCQLIELEVSIENPTAAPATNQP